MTDKELLKLWRKNRFTLRLYYTGKQTSEYRDLLSYQFKDGRKVIFEGDDFSPSPMYCIDSLQSVYSLLGFISLQPGNVDKEYFDNYTPMQLEWIQSDRCEELQLMVYDFEGA